MKKGSQSRKCRRCKKIVMWFIPDRNILGIQFDRTEVVRSFRFVKENPDGSGHYYCMDCLKVLYPDKY